MQSGDGSIPACAGEPRGSRPGITAGRVHPRVCGGADASDDAAERRKGPSPRVRGSRPAGVRRRLPAGSIPACAGEPRTRCRCSSPGRVHPRVCGGATQEQTASPSPDGPSPRVRGSRGGASDVHAELGSIPACAGEPLPLACTKSRKGVHPRVCGGAGPMPSLRASARGPSPRVRGSQRGPGRVELGEGSIPACAGEPRPRRPWRSRCRVHPRVCGGASASF